MALIGAMAAMASAGMVCSCGAGLGSGGQGCGLGQRLEHWAGLGQSACNRARHISPSTMRCRSIDGFIYADQNSNSQELNFLVRTIALMRIRFSAYMKKGADFF